MVVDLPAPFGPRSANVSPCSISERDAGEGGVVAVPLREVLHGHRGLAGSDRRHAPIVALLRLRHSLRAVELRINRSVDVGPMRGRASRPGRP